MVARSAHQIGNRKSATSPSTSADTRSRAIIEAMRTDEIAHGERALAAGGAALPTPLRTLMRCAAGVMTSTAYWV